MIYTITLNPSIDYILEIDEFLDGETNRSKSEEKIPGGKGIMVSIVLKNLGVESINLGFVGGFTGEFIKDKLDELEIENDFIKIEDDSRINIKLKNDKESEINAIGPNIKESEIEEFLNYLDELEEDDFVIISGSIPKSLGEDFYRVIVNLLEMNNVRFAIDTAGKKLYKLSAYKPFLIKPNKKELEEIFDCKLENDEKIIECAEKLIKQGAENIIVSLGEEGSIFIDENNIYKSKAISGKVVSTIGCGDSMVGGYIYGYMEGFSKLDSFKFAVAAASATAFSKDVGSKEYILKLLNEVEIEILK